MTGNTGFGGSFSPPTTYAALTCPLCTMDDVLCLPDHLEFATCDHEIDCRMNGLSIALKACYVKKVPK